MKSNQLKELRSQEPYPELESEMDQIESILDGICPACREDLVLWFVSGTEEFLVEFASLGDSETHYHQWVGTHSSEVGQLTYYCEECNLEFHIYQTKNRTWRYENFDIQF